MYTIRSYAAMGRQVGEISLPTYSAAYHHLPKLIDLRRAEVLYYICYAQDGTELWRFDHVCEIVRSLQERMK